MKENLMVVCYDYTLARRLASSLVEFLDMRFFDMFDMFAFNNAPYSLTDVLNINGKEYTNKEMRGIFKTELDFSGVVFVADPKIIGQNQDLFEKLKTHNLVLFLRRDFKTEFSLRENVLYKSHEEKEYLKLQIDELVENGQLLEKNLADVVIEIDDLNYEQIKEKIQKTLENIAE